jgi:LysR family hydrogen peroxide-inducible transcriptional activator
MNFQQLEYIVALERHRNFVAAANACFVSQPTLSAMVKKLEEELNIAIIKRGVHPLTFTAAGEQLLLQAKRILAEQHLMRELSKEIAGAITGEIRLSVIPSLAATVIPPLVQHIEASGHDLRVYISEMPTEKALHALLNGLVDMAVLATRSDEQHFCSWPLFEEEIVAYVSPLEKMPKGKYIQPDHLDQSQQWFLSEEHCFRDQALEICSRNSGLNGKVHYNAGSILSLVQLVDYNGGITLIPSAATAFLSKEQKSNIREFAPPAPTRLVQLTTLADYPRKKIVAYLSELMCR